MRPTITAAATALSFTFENSIEVLLILYKQVMGFKKGLKDCFKMEGVLNLCS